MGTAGFIAAVTLCWAAAMSPGPAVLMAARIGLRDGPRTGVALAVGIGLGALFWALAALFGLAVLFDYAPKLLLALKIGGAGYLMYLAYKMWTHAKDPIDTDLATAPLAPMAALRLGVVTQLANPKPAVFFGAVFLGTVPENTSTAMIAGLMGAIFAGEFLWNAVVARLFALEKTRNAYMNLKTLIDRAFGGMLAALGLKIAAT